MTLWGGQGEGRSVGAQAGRLSRHGAGPWRRDRTSFKQATAVGRAYPTRPRRLLARLAAGRPLGCACARGGGAFYLAPGPQQRPLTDGARACRRARSSGQRCSLSCSCYSTDGKPKLAERPGKQWPRRWLLALLAYQLLLSVGTALYATGADSDACRSVIPIHADHRFQCMPITLE